MTIRPRGRGFIVDVKVAANLNPTNTDVRVRTQARDRDHALRLEGMIRGEVIQTGQWTGEKKPGAPAPKAKRTGTLADALALAWNHPFEGWKLCKEVSAEGQRRNARHCLAILGEDTLCASITREDYQRVAKTFEDRGLSSDTIVRKLQALHRVLYFAEDAGWIKARPKWKRPSPGQPREFTFSPDLELEVIGYFRAILSDQDMEDLFCLGIDTGCRLGELLTLEASMVDLGAGWMRVAGEEGVTKNGERRTVTLEERAKSILRRRILAAGRKGRLFLGLTKEKVARRMAQAREGLGYEGEKAFCFHATRHTRATRLAERGVELSVMMGELGHKTPAITMRYINMVPTSRRAAILRSVGKSPLEEAQRDLG